MILYTFTNRTLLSLYQPLIKTIQMKIMTTLNLNNPLIPILNKQISNTYSTSLIYQLLRHQTFFIKIHSILNLDLTKQTPWSKKILQKQR